MTQNQINYAKLREEQRHNLATEGYSAIELQEAQRHNIAGESENVRHNAATEQLNWYLAPSQVSEREQHAKYYGMQSEYYPAYYELESGKLSIDQAKQQLAEKIADMDWYKIYYDVQNDRIRSEAQASQADTAARRVTEEVENWLRNYNFDVYQYDKTGRAKEVSEIVRNYVASGKDAVSIANAIVDFINKLNDRAKRNDLIPDDWQTFSTYN